MDHVNRRDVVIGGSTSAIALAAHGVPASAQIGNLFSGASQASSIPINSLQIFPLGGGGYVTGLEIANDGAKLCKTDVYNAYYMPAGSNTWRPVFTAASLGSNFATWNGNNTVWAISICKTNSNYFYVLCGDSGGGSGFNGRVWFTSDAGVTMQRTDLMRFPVGGEGSYGDRFTQNQIACDPNNGLVCYVGFTPFITTGGPGGVWVCYNGLNFTQLTSLPASLYPPGVAGIAIDGSFGTTTVGGVTVSKRVLVGIGGYGFYETFDGAVSWALTGSNPTPSTPMSITTSVADTVIVVQIELDQYRAANGITQTGGPTALTWTLRAGPTPAADVGTRDRAFGYYYYAIAPTAGTYTFNVNYLDGCLWLIGSLTGQPLVGYKNARVLAYALKDVDLTGSVVNFACSAAALGGGQGAGVSLTLTASGFIVSQAYAYVTSPDSGYTRLYSDATIGFWSEISTAIKTSGTYSVATGLGAESFGIIADAFKQKSGGALALDGTVVYATSAYASVGPSSMPCNPLNCDIANDGTLWVCDGPRTFAYGALFRYVRGASAGAGTWTRATLASGSGAPGYAGANSIHSVAIKPSDSNIVLYQNSAIFNAFQTANGAQSNINNVTWVGNAGFTGSNPTVIAATVGWQLHAGNSSPGGIRFNPVDNLVWSTNGLGVCYYSAGYNFDAPPAYSVTINWASQGIEEFIVSDYLAAPGSPVVLVALEDRMTMVTDGGTTGAYPAYYWIPDIDTNTWNMGYATDNNAFCFSLSTGLNGAYSAFSFNYGQVGYWNTVCCLPNYGGAPTIPPPYYLDPTVNVLGASGVAISSAQKTTGATFTGKIVPGVTVTSSSSVTMGTGNKSFTIAAGLSDTYVAGFPVNMYPVGSNEQMRGDIVSYNNSTGALVVNVTATSSSATFSSWTIYQCWFFNQTSIYGVLVVTSGLSGSIAGGQLLEWSGGTPSTFVYLVGNSTHAIVNDYTARQLTTTAITASTLTTRMALVLGANIFTAPTYTDDCGYTWHACAGAPADNYSRGLKERTTQCIAADRVAANTFYLYSPANGWYKSTDGAHNFSATGVGANLGAISSQVVCPEGYSGHVWAGGIENGGGLYYSTNGATSFTAVTGLANLLFWGMGAKKTGATYPTILAYCTFAGQTGLQYSNDMGVTWTYINQTKPAGTDLSGFGTIRGNWNIPGRFYITIYGVGGVWVQLY